MKIILIESCTDCPYTTPFVDPAYKPRHYCGKSATNECPAEGLPEWCPLSDAEERPTQ